MIKTVKLKDLNNFACEFSKTLKAGDTVLLNGDLGAGKTTFAKAVFACLGVKSNVTSPTFSILKTYHGKFLIHHFDAYRITTEEAIEAGFDEILSDKNSVKFIEWSENIADLIQEDPIIVNITKVNEDTRIYDITQK